MIKYGSVGIHRIYGFLILHHHGKTLKAHSRIDIFLLKLSVVSVSVIVELGKYYIPYLDKTVAFTAHHILRAGAVLFTSVVIYLRAWSAGALAVLPEIILTAELIYPRRIYMHLIPPYIEGLIILIIN